MTGVEGQKKHYLYKRVDGGSRPGTATFEDAQAITIGAGESVSMLPAGLRAIEAIGDHSGSTDRYYSDVAAKQTFTV